MHCLSQAWGTYVCIIPTLGRLRQKNFEYEAIPGYLVRPSELNLKKKSKSAIFWLSVIAGPGFYTHDDPHHRCVCVPVHVCVLHNTYVCKHNFKVLFSFITHDFSLFLKSRIFPTSDRKFGSSRRLEKTSKIGTVNEVFCMSSSLLIAKKEKLGNSLNGTGQKQPEKATH